VLLISRTLKCALILVALLAESGAGAEEFFGARAHRFQLTFAAGDFEKMTPVAPGDYPEVPAALQFQDRHWGAVSVRYKGNSSYRYAPTELKRSLKLRFDVPNGRPLFGLSELNLNNNAFDPTQLREWLAYDVFRRAGQPAPRTAFARLHVTVPGKYTRQYAGVFTLVEQVDEAFFERRWGQRVGLLLKPEGLTGMPYLGEDWASYEQSYDSRLDPAPADAAQFIAMVKLLNHASDEEFARRIGDYLDVDAFLRFLACEVVLVNTDSPLVTKRNYWITVHPATHKVVFVPWDMNMAFAGFKPSDADLSVREPTVAGAFPLAERMLANRRMASDYERIVREIVTSHFTVDRLSRQIAALESVIGDTEVREAAVVASMAPPLRQFVADRVSSVTAQLAGKRRGTPARAPTAPLRTTHVNGTSEGGPNADH
jgi:spore coat protein H